MKRIAPGAVHVDGTARPQILSKRFNASFYKLVDMYCRCTRGQSILINTSFNIHGQPIVLNLADCIATFGRSLLDALVVDNTLIMRS
jgi:carbamoyltransferase